MCPEVVQWRRGTQSSGAQVVGSILVILAMGHAVSLQEMPGCCIDTVRAVRN